MNKYIRLFALMNAHFMNMTIVMGLAAARIHRLFTLTMSDINLLVVGTLVFYSFNLICIFCLMIHHEHELLVTYTNKP